MQLATWQTYHDSVTLPRVINYPSLVSVPWLTEFFMTIFFSQTDELVFIEFKCSIVLLLTGSAQLQAWVRQSCIILCLLHLEKNYQEQHEGTFCLYNFLITYLGRTWHQYLANALGSFFPCYVLQACSAEIMVVKLAIYSVCKGYNDYSDLK